jgi:DNA end-binding protein Ku
VREADFDTLEDNVRVSPQELKMASSLVDNMAGDFAPDKFSDEYQDQLKKLIAAKLEQGDKLDTAATFGEEGQKADDADVIDLMEALRQSVERNRAAREGRGDSDSKSPAKKTAAKKSAAKKSSSKSPAKKKAAKKAS